MIITTTTTTAPTNPCVGSFTTNTGAFIVAETMDASGVFMVQVACPAPFGMLLMNNANFAPTPSTFSCDAASGKYIYFPAGVQTPINTIGCS
uniref:Uncharacterized protein n=1 Tax=Panagrolaimus sp. PS1159 TaxID=55785 RepID=A0AC35ERN6_9BILA